MLRTSEALQSWRCLNSSWPYPLRSHCQLDVGTHTAWNPEQRQEPSTWPKWQSNCEHSSCPHLWISVNYVLFSLLFSWDLWHCLFEFMCWNITTSNFCDENLFSSCFLGHTGDKKSFVDYFLVLTTYDDFAFWVNGFPKIKAKFSCTSHHSEGYKEEGSGSIHCNKSYLDSQHARQRNEEAANLVGCIVSRQPQGPQEVLDSMRVAWGGSSGQPAVSSRHS